MPHKSTTWTAMSALPTYKKNKKANNNTNESRSTLYQYEHNIHSNPLDQAHDNDGQLCSEKSKPNIISSHLIIISSLSFEGQLQSMMSMCYVINSQFHTNLLLSSIFAQYMFVIVFPKKKKKNPFKQRDRERKRLYQNRRHQPIGCRGSSPLGIATMLDRRALLP